MHVEHQVTLSEIKTLKCKIKLDRFEAESIVKIISFQRDNGIFISTNFMETLFETQHSIRFSGAGAAHQNGIAEHIIKIIINKVCTLFIHAAIHSEEGTIRVEL